MIIAIEGVDKTGKNLLHRYLEIITKYRYCITDRGILTQLVYNKKFNRHIIYDIENYKNQIIVLLTADVDDLKIRHKISNEPKINIASDLELFDKGATELRRLGFTVIEFNTSMHTPFEIANVLAIRLKELEKTHGF